MSDEKMILSSLALDLRRVAQGYYRGSNTMADRFFEEALKRKSEAENLKLKPYISRLLEKIGKIQLEREPMKKAEDALMYSILFQNAAISS